MSIHKLFQRTCLALVFAFVAVGFINSTSAQAATSAEIRRAQTIMNKFGLPTGPIDGQMGPQTKRGLCAFRYISGMEVSRSGNISTALMNKLVDFDNRYSSLKQVPVRKNVSVEHMVAQKTCQVMFHSLGNGKYNKAMPISTGVKGTTPDGKIKIETPNKPRNSSSSYFTLGNTAQGWFCSTQFPGSCQTHNVGRFRNVDPKRPSNFGNMYNMRWMNDGGLYVHGSTTVPTYPDSGGCIRVTVADSDWMWDHVGNNGTIRLYVEGKYNWNH